MIIKTFFLILLFPILLSQAGFSENEIPKSATISGFVRDAKNGETLTGAFIYPEENPGAGITSNSYGYFSLTLPIGKYIIIVQYLGYKVKTIPLELKENLKINVELEEESIP